MASPSSTPDAPMAYQSGPDVPYAGPEHSEATAWIAWVLLGAIMLIVLGGVHVGLGLIALFRPEVLAASRADLLLPVGLTALAWGHLVIGVIAVVTGVQLMRARRWPRVIAIVLTAVAALVNFAFIDVYPVWSITVIVLAVLVIYAVAAHGGEMAGVYSGS